MDALRTRVPVDQGGEHNERKQDDPLQYEQLKGIACLGRGTTFRGPFAVESSQHLSYIYNIDHDISQTGKRHIQQFHAGSAPLPFMRSYQEELWSSRT